MNSFSADPAPIDHRKDQVEWDGGCTALLAGGIVYAICCLPMIRRTEWQQIDPAWQITPFLWFVPYIISAIFDRLPQPIRLTWLVSYGVITACVVAWCLEPRALFVPGVILWGLVHVFSACAIEVFIQVVRNFGGWLLTGYSITRNIIKWTSVFLISVAAITVPFVWRERVFAQSFEAGQRVADNAWQTGKCRISPGPSFYGTRIGDVVIRRMFDPITGLEFGGIASEFRFEQGYDQRVRELVSERGYPPRSMKPYFVLDQDLVELLDSKEMREITEFPHQLTDGLRLERNPAKSVPSLKINLSRPNPHMGSFLQVYLRDHESVFVSKLDKYPDVAFIRIENHTLYALHQMGEYLAETIHEPRLEKRDQQDGENENGP